MPSNLLQTKLYMPRLRPSLVTRPHLIEKLNQGWQQASKLTLISAPAGFGKTTLVSEWVTGCKRPFAWLSLDEGDTDLTRFLTYFVAALQTVAANVGEEVLTALQSPQLPPTESILTVLLNDITTVSEHFILVLDDYHVVDGQSVDDALTFLLEHLPPKMHLVITTREDPNLPLARWRVRNQLTELRASDLRFSLAETAEFLNQVMGLNLSEDRYRHVGNPHRRLDCRSATCRTFDARASRIFPDSFRHSPETTAILWIIWSKRSCSVSLNLFEASYFRHPSSTA